MAPPFIFRIDEFTEHPDAVEQVDKDGKWIPIALRGYNIRVGGGVSGQWWCCDGDSIYQLSGWSPPQGSIPYKTFSTIYSGGHGFHIMQGDATTPAAEACWQHLWFEWNERSYASTLTNAGTRRTLQVQNSGSRWPRMLLPDIYHGADYPYQGYGGLTGDLAIFLALVAFSMKPERLSTELPNMMDDGEWQEHQRSPGRTDKRGVIVYVYPYGQNNVELKNLEDGNLGLYYR